MTGPEVLAVTGAFVASAFGLARMVLGHQQAAINRLASLLESNLDRQAATLERFEQLLSSLDTSVRDSGELMQRLIERLPIHMRSGEP